MNRLTNIILGKEEEFQELLSLIKSIEPDPRRTSTALFVRSKYLITQSILFIVI
jgi:hypothetical protein